MSANVLYDAPGPKARRLSVILSVVFTVVFAGLIGLVLYQLWLGGTFYADRWDIFQDPQVWSALGRGLTTTLTIALVAGALALVIGMVFALLRASKLAAVRIPATIVLEFFRGMPVLLMILFVLIVFQAEAYWAVVAALAVYNGAIIGEALRAGIAGLPKGQRESGLAIGLGSLQTTLLIEFPQAFRNMLPIIIAQLVVLLKDTALGYIVGSQDLIWWGRRMAEFFGAGQYALSMFFVLLASYLALNLSLSWFARFVSRQVAKPRKGGRNLDGTRTEPVQLSTQALRTQHDGDDAAPGAPRP